MSTPTLLPTAATPRVNLLPPEVEEERRWRRVRPWLAALLVLLLAVLTGLYVAAARNADEASERLDTAEGRGDRLQAKEQTYAEVSRVSDRIAAEEQLLADARRREIRWSHFLDGLSVRISDGVWLSTMTVATERPRAPAGDTRAEPDGLGVVTFEGSAYDYDAVAGWLEMLGREPGFTNPYLTESRKATEAGTDVVDFTSTVSVTDQALWRQYRRVVGE